MMLPDKAFASVAHAGSLPKKVSPSEENVDGDCLLGTGDKSVVIKSVIMLIL